MIQNWKTNQTTSKIYKLYINGKPKRQGTQQYPYLGSKVPVVAGKCDPTIGQPSFHRIFQTVRNLRKRTTRMSSEGPKIGGGRYESAWNGRKTAKFNDPRWPSPPRSPARSGRVRRRFAVIFGRQGRLTLLFLPGQRVCKDGVRNSLPRLKADWPENGSKRPSSGFTGLGEFFSGFGAEMSVLGLDTLFGTQN